MPCRPPHTTSLRPWLPRRARGARRRTGAPAWLPVGLACALACLPARPEIIEWTGNFTTLVARGDFGRGFETLEFASRPQWLSVCGAYPAAICAATTFWGSRGNWPGNILPTAADDVRTPEGSTVVVNSFNSQLQGDIEGFAQANYLNAAGSLVVGLGSALVVGSADIANLALSGVVASTGRVNVAHYSGSLGQFTGSGTTRIQAVDDRFFMLRVAGGHRLEFSGSFAGDTDIEVVENSTFVNDGSFSSAAHGTHEFLLYGQSTFVNRATLGAGDDRLSVVGAGTFNPGTQSRIQNLGTIETGLSFSGTRFDNDGLVKVREGQSFSAQFNGTHSGRFEGEAGSTMRFGNFGQSGHSFLPGSGIASQGRVVFARGASRVAGSYHAERTEVGSQIADVRFSGTVDRLPLVVVSTGSSAIFETAAGVRVDRIELAGQAAFNTGLGSSVGTAQLRGAGAGLAGGTVLLVTELLDMDGGTAANVDIQGDLLWSGGRIEGNSQVSGTSTWTDGARSLGGQFTSNTDTAWRAGNFVGWDGVFINPAGRRVDLQGDYSIAAGNGRLINRGLFGKTGGRGTAVVGVALDNTGQVTVSSGTLHLAGGGQHSSLLAAAPGAAILLGGDQVFAAGTLVQGAVDMQGGRLTLLPGMDFATASTQTFAPDRLAMLPSSRFTNHGLLAWRQSALSGVLDNHGDLVAYSLDNQGVLINQATGSFILFNGLGGATPVSVNGPTAVITNLGTMQIGAADLRNLGQIDNQRSLLQGGSLTVVDTASGTIGRVINGQQGRFYNSGVLTLAGQSSLTNDGAFFQSGRLWIDPAAVLGGAGSFRQTGGLTTVYGVLEARGGIFVDEGVINGYGQLVGPLSVGNGRVLPGNSPGTLTVLGDLTFTAAPDVVPAAPHLEIEVASATSFDILRVSGAVDLGAALIEFQFAPDYAPVDGAVIRWLQAGRLIDSCGTSAVGACPTFRSTGLGADWVAGVVQGTHGLGLELINEPATLDGSSQISSAPFVDIAPGVTATNWNSSTALDSLRNHGTFHNRPGADLLVPERLFNGPSGTISNRGSIAASVLVNEGVAHNRSDGRWLVTAGFSNAGQVVNNGLLELYAIDNTNSGSMSNSGTMRTAGLANTPTGRFDNTGQLELSGQGLYNQGSFTVSGLVTADGSAGIYNDSGLFTVTQDGRVEALGAYVDNGGITRVAGRLQAGAITLRGGRLTGSGTLVGNTTLENTTVTVDRHDGAPTIDGTLILRYGLFEVDLDGRAGVTGLHVTGQVQAQGPAYARFRLLNGYQPTVGDTFSALSSDAGFAGQAFSGYLIYTEILFDGQHAEQPWSAPAGVMVHFDNGRVTVAAVPEPASWLLWAFGLTGWLTMRRTRRNADRATPTDSGAPRLRDAATAR